MPQSVKTSSPSPDGGDLPLAQMPNSQQLDDIKAHLDLVWLALESLAGIGSDALLRAANKLNLTSVAGDRIGLWRLRQSDSWRNSRENKIDVEEARFLVRLIGYLARENQELIRRAVSLLEQISAQAQDPHHTALLGEYLETFGNAYQMHREAEVIAPQESERLACKLLVDLLFYSSANGHRRLWSTLVEPA